MGMEQKSHTANIVKVDARTPETRALFSIGAKPKLCGNKGNISYGDIVVIELRHVPKRSLAKPLSGTTGRAKVTLYNVMGNDPGDVTVFQLRLILDMSAVYKACRVPAHTPLAVALTITGLPLTANGSFICATVKIPKSRSQNHFSAMGAKRHSAERKALASKAPESQIEHKTTPAEAKRCAAERAKAHNEAVRKIILDVLCKKYPNRMDVVRLGGVNAAAQEHRPN
jgi:hypothetical protein